MDNDKLRMKMLLLKKKLPNKYMSALIEKFPKYQSQKDRVRKVVALQVIDGKIINDLEAIAL